ncbi:E3 ubiquitin-protein ligase Topors-like [Cyrtonyx montezumae]|uniref:E3 ubiquitin-protein ligase Topors-like n=1 Tax=Cyrtonyx montezumae TaxID=9017 RepID=UPI0032D9CCB6
MASSTDEDLKPGGSAASSNASQLCQAGPCQEEDNRCPICLDAITNAAHVPTCFHSFCFSCIWQWASMNAVCPICRKPFDRVLCAMEADGDYQQYLLSPFTHRQRQTSRQRMQNRSRQQQNNLRPHHSNDQPVEGRTEPAGGQQVPRINAAEGPSVSSTFREPALPNVVQHPASPVEGHPRNFSMMMLRARLLHFLDLE